MQGEEDNLEFWPGSISDISYCNQLIAKETLIGETVRDWGKEKRHPGKHNSSPRTSTQPGLWSILEIRVNLWRSHPYATYKGKQRSTWSDTPTIYPWLKVEESISWKEFDRTSWRGDELGRLILYQPSLEAQRTNSSPSGGDMAEAINAKRVQWRGLNVQIRWIDEQESSTA